MLEFVLSLLLGGLLAGIMLFVEKKSCNIAVSWSGVKRNQGVSPLSLLPPASLD